MDLIINNFHILKINNQNVKNKNNREDVGPADISNSPPRIKKIKEEKKEETLQLNIINPFTNRNYVNDIEFPMHPLPPITTKHVFSLGTIKPKPQKVKARFYRDIKLWK
ncbi:hypothetical protein DLAC_09625 [Tieghemostelium lacteum]|uniref:Uncharacterized protein n=1 Tax=Tieghemostelium lacteum TaxID=361077 RepID=A0A151Z6S2_TIELA|nr:hypothetical protein DLAC_09625 [Tieghemostelium lacteum]|eukprot:KYQ89659.1 hypothetical protein DLAC_09625 [Tieghemostelium lacteum]